jgi:hypothetical protein
MKTLKELFNSRMKTFQGCSFEDTPLYMTEYFLEDVKKWLTQKQQETLPHKITNESSDAKIINKFIDELLENLKK